MSTNPDQLPTKHVDLTWFGELEFQARNPNGVKMVLDSNRRHGFSPMESLLASLCGCMAMDVVSILKKMRVPPTSFSVTADAEQNPEPPKYFRRITLHFEIEGAVPREKTDHAVQLSFKSYCSVFHTLRKDIEFSYDIALAEERDGKGQQTV